MHCVQTLGWPHKDKRLHMVGTIGKKLGKLDFILSFEF